MSIGALAALLATCSSAGVAPDEGAPREVKVFDQGRAIPQSRSASRDAPAFSLMMAPRGTRTAATEFAFLAVPVAGMTVRPGFYGLLELDGDERAHVAVWPSQVIHYWRGAFAFPVAVALEDLGRRLCGRCALEATLQFRHESEHYTGSNHGGKAIDYSNRPIFGDAIVLDAAGAAGLGEFWFFVRVGNAFFLPDRSSYRLGPALDVHARFVRWRRWQPFISGYAEHLFGAQRGNYWYPAAYLARTLVGVALPSGLGDILLFASGDVGHRKGLVAYTKEATLGFGIRFALGRLPGAEPNDP